MTTTSDPGGRRPTGFTIDGVLPSVVATLLGVSVIGSVDTALAVRELRVRVGQITDTLARADVWTAAEAHAVDAMQDSRLTRLEGAGTDAEIRLKELAEKLARLEGRR